MLNLQYCKLTIFQFHVAARENKLSCDCTRSRSRTQHSPSPSLIAQKASAAPLHIASLIGWMLQLRQRTRSRRAISARDCTSSRTATTNLSPTRTPNSSPRCCCGRSQRPSRRRRRRRCPPPVPRRVMRVPELPLCSRLLLPTQQRRLRRRLAHLPLQMATQRTTSRCKLQHRCSTRERNVRPRRAPARTERPPRAIAAKSRASRASAAAAPKASVVAAVAMAESARWRWRQWTIWKERGTETRRRIAARTMRARRRPPPRRTSRRQVRVHDSTEYCLINGREFINVCAPSPATCVSILYTHLIFWESRVESRVETSCSRVRRSHHQLSAASANAGRAARAFRERRTRRELQNCSRSKHRSAPLLCIHISAIHIDPGALLRLSA